jgi:hypothetical protein
VKCGECGARNPKKKKFCGDCGAELMQEGTQLADPPQRKVAQRERRSKSTVILGLIGLGGAVLLCGLLVGIGIMNVLDNMRNPSLAPAATNSMPQEGPQVSPTERPRPTRTSGGPTMPSPTTQPNPTTPPIPTKTPTTVPKSDLGIPGLYTWEDIQGTWLGYQVQNFGPDAFNGWYSVSCVGKCEFRDPGNPPPDNSDIELTANYSTSLPVYGYPLMMNYLTRLNTAYCYYPAIICCIDAGIVDENSSNDCALLSVP